MKGIECIELRKFITEYKQKNEKNEFKPVAVGKYGIRTRESIYSKELAKDYSKNKIIFKNTLTVGMGSRQIDIGILTDDVIYSVSPAYHTYKISGINADYLRYCLMCRNEDMFKRFVKRGSRQGKSIDLKRWLEYEIPVYDVCNQEKTVLKLNKVTNVISMRKQQLQKLDELIQARFVELFGNESNPKAWEIVNVESVADVQVGVVIKPSQYYTDAIDGIKAFRSLNVGEGFIKDENWVYFTKEGHKKNAKSVLKENDLLIVRSGAPGTACVVTKEYEGCNAIDIIIAHPNCEKVNPYYLCAYTNMPHGKKQINEGTGGAAQQHFNVTKYNKLQLMLPPMKLQDEFVTFVNQVNKSKVEIQQALEKTQLLFDSLMQQYFG